MICCFADLPIFVIKRIKDFFVGQHNLKQAGAELGQSGVLSWDSFGAEIAIRN